MTPATAMRGRLLAAVAAVAALLIVVVGWFQTTSDPRSEVIGDSPSRAAWKTVEYEGVRIDIPSAWERLEMDDCEFQFERWARPGSLPCDFEEGAAFYGSATFDPVHGPGVRRATDNVSPTWGGYIYVGDFAVYASYGDPDLVRDVLASARRAG
jgi:hypothetical protein